MELLSPVCIQFTKKMLEELNQIPGRVIFIVCDGSRGQSARILGLSDEFSQHSCKAYGAVAALERTQETSVPTSETSVHNITFNHVKSFHFKLFGSFRHRYVSLVVPIYQFKQMRANLDKCVNNINVHNSWLLRFGKGIMAN